MRIFVPKETAAVETRVPLTAEGAGKLVKLGATVEMESLAGASIAVPDSEYAAQGAQIAEDRNAGLSAADIVLRLSRPPIEEIKLMKPGAIHISHLDPFNNLDAIKELARTGATAISLELIPRTTLAQKMDVLSSQANLAGYVAVVLAANRLNRIFPMMMTPAGTLSPARVFVIGAGVAGLQAIATARRLGARVDAFDVRPAVEEQVRSLGAKFLKVDIGETGETKQGYAKQLSEEQIKRQREAMANQSVLSDVVITTAQVFGKRAPTIITAEMVERMKPGSVIVDLAIESGGNVEGSRLDEEVVVGGVRIIGYGQLSRRVPVHASQMFSSNVVAFIEHFWDKQESRFKLDFEDEILKGSLVTYDNRVVNDTVENLMR